MKKAEKIPHATRRASAEAKRTLKRIVRRNRRRTEARDPEDAPVPTRAFIRGWYW